MKTPNKKLVAIHFVCFYLSTLLILIFTGLIFGEKHQNSYVLVGIVGVVVYAVLFGVITFLSWAVKRLHNENEANNTKQDSIENSTEKVCNPEDYVVDEKDKHLFYSPLNNDFAIRIIGPTKKDKDLLRVCFSLTHGFSEQVKNSMLRKMPNLVTIDYSRSHEILITKSPAVKFPDLQDALLKYLFSCLHNEYKCTYEKQSVVIETTSNKDMVLLNLSFPTNKHLTFASLARLLLSLSDVPRHLPLDRGLKSDYKNGSEKEEVTFTYEFISEKDVASIWKDFLSKIKKVFEDYFPGGVEFVEK